VPACTQACKKTIKMKKRKTKEAKTTQKNTSSLFGFLNPYINNSKFWKEKKRYRVLYGGRASGKSHEFATMLVILSAIKPLKILCTRAFQNKIKDSVKSLLEEKISTLKLEHLFKVERNSIRSAVGSEFLFYGLARNTQEIKSLEGVDICYIEEGQYITKEMWDILVPTIRKDRSEIWVSFNPLLVTDFIYNYFVLNAPDNAIVLKINYNNNPFLSKTMLEEIESKKGDYDFRHIYLGEPKSDAQNSIIKGDWIKKAFIDEATIKKGGVIGVDIADGGEDTNAISVVVDNKLIYIEEFKSERGDFSKLSNRVISLISEYRCSVVVFDSVGVGAGFGAILRNNLSEHKKSGVVVKEFIAGAKVSGSSVLKRYIGDRDKFTNIKAQMWVYLGELLKREEFKIKSSPLNNKLLLELTAPQLVEKEGRKLAVESKESMKKRGVNSPNLADSLIIALSNSIRASWI
jgi:phage terminase large subunit